MGLFKFRVQSCQKYITDEQVEGWCVVTHLLRVNVFDGGGDINNNSNNNINNVNNNNNRSCEEGSNKQLTNELWTKTQFHHSAINLCPIRWSDNRNSLTWPPGGSSGTWRHWRQTLCTRRTLPIGNSPPVFQSAVVSSPRHLFSLCGWSKWELLNRRQHQVQWSSASEKGKKWSKWLVECTKKCSVCIQSQIALSYHPLCVVSKNES